MEDIRGREGKLNGKRRGDSRERERSEIIRDERGE